MKYPKAAEPIERDEARVLEEVEAQHSALADAQRESAELQQRRRRMLATADIAEIEDIDAAIVRAATKIEIAQAKVDASESELECLRAAASEAQSAANLVRARQLAEEARQLIVGAYAQAARAIAETLGILAKIENEVHVLNSDLPPDAAAIEIEASGVIA